MCEKQVQETLQLLNYEVYCSTEAYTSASQFPVHRYFSIICISETFTNSETEHLLDTLDIEQALLIRLSAMKLEEKERSVFIDPRFQGCLSKKLPEEQLREELSDLKQVYIASQQEKRAQRSLPMYKPDARSLDIAAGKVKFSKKEGKLFKKLLDLEGEYMTREALCEYLWEEGDNDSNRSQLSCLASKIKKKLKMTGYVGETIVTRWGGGYRLDIGFCNYMKAGATMNELLNATVTNVQVTAPIAPYYSN